MAARVIIDYKRKCPPMGKSSTHCPSSGAHKHGPGCVVGNESIMIRYVVLGEAEHAAQACSGSVSSCVHLRRHNEGLCKVSVHEEGGCVDMMNNLTRK